jgi:hypothetical protein
VFFFGNEPFFEKKFEDDSFLGYCGASGCIALMMEAVRTSETSVNLCELTAQYPAAVRT